MSTATGPTRCEGAPVEKRALQREGWKRDVEVCLASEICTRIRPSMWLVFDFGTGCLFLHIGRLGSIRIEIDAVKSMDDLANFKRLLGYAPAVSSKGK